MSGISFLSNNLVDNAVLALTSGTANAQFPLSNIQNDSPSLKFRSTTNTVTLVIDTQVTQNANSLSIVGDPTGVLGVTAATFKSSTTLDFSLSTPIVMTLSSEFNMGLEYTTDTSDRYWQIELTGQGSYVEIGNIYIGERTNLPQNSISIGSFTYGNDDKSTVRKNQYGQRFVDLRNKVKTLAGSIEFCTQSETETLDDLWQVHGVNKPLWVVVDKDSQAMTDGEFRLSMYGYLTKLPSWRANGGQLYTTSLKMEQAI